MSKVQQNKNNMLQVMTTISETTICLKDYSEQFHEVRRLNLEYTCLFSNCKMMM